MNFRPAAKSMMTVAGVLAAAAGAGGCVGSGAGSGGVRVSARVPPGVELPAAPGSGGPGGVEPDRRLTPGAVFAGATVGQICRPGYAASQREVPIALKRQVFLAYGVRYLRGRFTVDHLVPLELGGANVGRDPRTGRVVATANLWPEPSAGATGAAVKDRLENRLAELVCRGSVDLAFAQRLIARDWLAAARWVGERFPARGRPPSGGRGRPDDSPVTSRVSWPGMAA